MFMKDSICTLFLIRIISIVVLYSFFNIDCYASGLESIQDQNIHRSHAVVAPLEHDQISLAIQSCNQDLPKAERREALTFLAWRMSKSTDHAEYLRIFDTVADRFLELDNVGWDYFYETIMKVAADQLHGGATRTVYWIRDFGNNKDKSKVPSYLEAIDLAQKEKIITVARDGTNPAQIQNLKKILNSDTILGRQILIEIAPYSQDPEIIKLIEPLLSSRNTDNEAIAYAVCSAIITNPANPNYFKVAQLLYFSSESHFKAIGREHLINIASNPEHRNVSEAVDCLKSSAYHSYNQTNPIEDILVKIAGNPRHPDRVKIGEYFLEYPSSSKAAYNKLVCQAISDIARNPDHPDWFKVVRLLVRWEEADSKRLALEAIFPMTSNSIVRREEDVYRGLARETVFYVASNPTHPNYSEELFQYLDNMQLLRIAFDGTHPDAYKIARFIRVNAGRSRGKEGDKTMRDRGRNILGIIAKKINNPFSYEAACELLTGGNNDDKIIASEALRIMALIANHPECKAARYTLSNSKNEVDRDFVRKIWIVIANEPLNPEALEAAIALQSSERTIFGERRLIDGRIALIKISQSSSPHSFDAILELYKSSDPEDKIIGRSMLTLIVQNPLHPDQVKAAINLTESSDASDKELGKETLRKISADPKHSNTFEAAKKLWELSEDSDKADAKYLLDIVRNPAHLNTTEALDFICVPFFKYTYYSPRIEIKGILLEVAVNTLHPEYFKAIQYLKKHYYDDESKRVRITTLKRLAFDPSNSRSLEAEKELWDSPEENTKDIIRPKLYAIALNLKDPRAYAVAKLLIKSKNIEDKKCGKEALKAFIAENPNRSDLKDVLFTLFEGTSVSERVRTLEEVLTDTMDLDFIKDQNFEDNEFIKALLKAVAGKVLHPLSFMAAKKLWNSYSARNSGEEDLVAIASSIKHPNAIDAAIILWEHHNSNQPYYRVGETNSNTVVKGIRDLFVAIAENPAHPQFFKVVLKLFMSHKLEDKELARDTLREIASDRNSPNRIEAAENLYEYGNTLDKEIGREVLLNRAESSNDFKDFHFIIELMDSGNERNHEDAMRSLVEIANNPNHALAGSAIKEIYTRFSIDILPHYLFPIVRSLEHPQSQYARYLVLGAAYDTRFASTIDEDLIFKNLIYEAFKKNAWIRRKELILNRWRLRQQESPLN